MLPWGWLNRYKKYFIEECSMNFSFRVVLTLRTVVLCSLLVVGNSVCAKKCADERKSSDCCIDTSLAIAKFGECKNNPIKGKNVLIIGASKGNGNGAAQAFYNAGANVVGTSRSPKDYTGQPWLSETPIDITIDESVENFFKAEPTVVAWDHIDILVLSGTVESYGTLLHSKASDLYAKVASEFFGRHRVVERAIKKMQRVDDSRIITLSSISSFFPLPFVGAYSPAKGALNAWVKQWNAEREWFKELTGEYVCKTLAIAVQPSWVNNSPGALPPSLCNPQAPLPRSAFGQYPSGVEDPFSQPLVGGIFGWYGNSLAQGQSKEDVGLAILYTATVPHPEWFYIVEKNGDEQYCSGCGSKSLNCAMRKLSQHKVRDEIIEYIRGYNWNAAFENILFEGNSKKYSWFICPPINQKAAATPVPELPADYPNCSGGFISGVPANVISQDQLDDLVNNPCKPNNPC